MKSMYDTKLGTVEEIINKRVSKRAGRRNSQLKITKSQKAEHTSKITKINDETK